MNLMSGEELYQKKGRANRRIIVGINKNAPEATKAGGRVSICGTVRLRGRSRIDGDLLALAIEAFERHHARDQGVKGEVATQADVAARVELRSDLAHQDLAGIDELAAEALHAAHFRIT